MKKENKKELLIIIIIFMIGLLAIFTLAKNAERIDKQEQTLFINK